MQEEPAYEFRLKRMLRPLRGSIFEGNTAPNFIVSKVGLRCFDYLFSAAWFSTRFSHF